MKSKKSKENTNIEIKKQGQTGFVKPGNLRAGDNFFRINSEIKIPELLAPAGNFEKMKVAINYGADAVYMGGHKYSLRSNADNFSRDEIEEAVAYAHSNGVKVYITINIFAHNRDFIELEDYLSFLVQAGVDGLIISDPGILAIARKICPDTPVHLSTQANITNVQSALFWQEQGVRRVNLARELSLAEIREVRKGFTADIELFVHGAICISYSGRCLLSYYLTGRDANQGNCAHPCRYRYQLVEEKRPGEYFQVEEDSRGTYIFNAKDLCLLSHLPDLISSGIDSLKIEGRMKGISYVGSVVRLYRNAIDYWVEKLSLEKRPGHGEPQPEVFNIELSKTGCRGQTENFIKGEAGEKDMLYHGVKVDQSFAPIGLVRTTDPEPEIDVRNVIKTGMEFEYLEKNLENTVYRIIEIKELSGKNIDQGNPGTRVRLKLEPEPENWQTYSLLRKVSC
jgi:U32 family peptidase